MFEVYDGKCTFMNTIVILAVINVATVVVYFIILTTVYYCYQFCYTAMCPATARVYKILYFLVVSSNSHRLATYV